MSGKSPSPTLAALRATVAQRWQDYDRERAAQRLQDAVVRGAVVGLSLRGGLHLVGYLLQLLARRWRKRGGPSQAGADALALLRDTARWGAFLGSFSGLFVFWDELIAMLGGRKRTRAWRAMASGALAGPAMLLTGTQQSHTSLALYVLIRGLTLLIRCGNLPQAHPLKRALLAPTRWRHGDVALMCLSTAQIGYSWIALPQTLPPSYVRFLDRHGGKAPHVYAAVREMTRRAAAGGSAAACTAAPLAALAGTELAGFRSTIPCGFLHPGQACTQHTASFFPGAYLRALPVYFPVYVVPAILVHRKRLLQPNKAPQLWRKVALGVLRSSLFLSLYCTLAWRGACAGFNLAGRTTGAVIAGSCWVAGFAALVEKRPRRMELALYCLSRAAESFALTLAAWGWVRPSSLPRRVDVLMFSLASACILHCYSDHFGQRRDVFRSSYLNVFDFILGNTGFQHASISHQPSNAEYILRGMRSPRAFPSFQPQPAEQPGDVRIPDSSSSAGGGTGGPAAGIIAAVQVACLAYDRAVKANPVLTKALTSFVGFAVGDRIAQGVAGAGPYDALRCGRLSLYGLLLDGPVGHLWYKLLDRHVYPEDPTCTRAVLIKTALDQLVWGPIMTLVFFAFLKTLEGHPELILETISRKFWPTMLANYVLWPLAHLVNFKFVPTDYRILFNNVVAIFWTTYLSFTCGPASGGSGLGTPGGAEAAAAAASALLSTIPCHKIPGALAHPEVAAAVRQVAAVEHMLGSWGSQSLPSADLLVNYFHLKAEVMQSVCQQPIRLPPS
ncbi:hypothetical protein ABPG75_007775 [Micractinium tetrahymenae]